MVTACFTVSAIFIRTRHTGSLRLNDGVAVGLHENDEMRSVRISQPKGNDDEVRNITTELGSPPAEGGDGDLFALAQRVLGGDKAHHIELFQ